MRLTNLIDELRREHPWLKVVGVAEVGATIVQGDTWKRRGLEYAGTGPLSVTWHHTASGGSQLGILRFELYKYDSAPGNNVNIAPDGTVYVLAVGSCYTNGKVTLRRFSRGMGGNNATSFTMEIHNPGNGTKPYPQAQVDACFAVSNTVNRLSRNKPTDLATHHELAPDRKTDPATAAAVQGPWKPRSCTSSGTWHGDDIRGEAVRRAGGATTPTTPTTPTTTEDDDMFVTTIIKHASRPHRYGTNKTGGGKVWLPSSGALEWQKKLLLLNGLSTDEQVYDDNDKFAGFGPILGPPPGDVDGWGNPKA